MSSFCLYLSSGAGFGYGTYFRVYSRWSLRGIHPVPTIQLKKVSASSWIFLQNANVCSFVGQASIQSYLYDLCVFFCSLGLQASGGKIHHLWYNRNAAVSDHFGPPPEELRHQLSSRRTKRNNGTNNSNREKKHHRFQKAQWTLCTYHKRSATSEAESPIARWNFNRLFSMRIKAPRMIFLVFIIPNWQMQVGN